MAGEIRVKVVAVVLGDLTAIVREIAHERHWAWLRGRGAGGSTILYGRDPCGAITRQTETGCGSNLAAYCVSGRIVLRRTRTPRMYP